MTRRSKYRLAIVGGSGYVGSSLAKYLSRRFDVRVLDVKQPSEEVGFSFASCDVRNYHQVKRALNDVDLVIHTAVVQIPLINEQRRLGYQVNIVGTQNVCQAVDENPQIRGMILAGSWHVIGEAELEGVVNEAFGFRPDKVEDRARLYAFSKIAQEAVVRFYDEMSDKIYGIIRMGTVLGDGMPDKTAANIFISRGLRGEKITPYKHSMYRPMLYVDIRDVCVAYERFALKLLNGELRKTGNSLTDIVNLYYPEPITILELAEIVRNIIVKYTRGEISPQIEIVDQRKPLLFTKEDKEKIRVDVSKAIGFLGFKKLKSPRESIAEIIKLRLKNSH